jgi:hypothetical protein
MKKNYKFPVVFAAFVAASLFTTTSLLAQNVGINSTGGAPDAGAMLDISSTNKGLLIPRVSIGNLTLIAPITGSATTSLLVYNTNATTGLGYHYWDGNDWIPLGNDSDWKITGNGNITGGTHFLGTTNNIQLDFRTNNATRFSVKSNGDQVFAAGNGTNALPFYSWSADPDIGMYRITTNTLGFATSAVERFRMSTTEAVFNDASNNYDFRIESNGSQNMFFVDASTDRIGIGINNPAFDLEMQTNVNGDYIASFENLNANGSSLLGYQNAGGYNALGGVTNFATGLGSYGVSLQAFGGSIAMWGTSNSSDAYGVYGSIPTTGSWLGYGGVFTGGLGYVNGLYNLSDERVKSNIQVISKAVDKLKQIKGVSYTYNLEKYNYLARGDTRTYLGFLAQDIEKVFPEAVAKKQLIVEGPEKMSATADMSKFKRETFNVVDYTAIVPVLVEAVKEQQTIIESQEERIKALELKVEQLLKNK